MDAATQKGRILRYCAEKGSITIREAFALDINSPSKRISEMRLSGDYDFSQIQETRVNGKGETKRYMRYFIKKREGETS